jgi:signal transduction histidine kinase
MSCFFIVLQHVSGVRRHLKQKTVTISTVLSEGRVVLAVKDQGQGIPKQIRDNLGKSFLATKENGTGLGMAISYRIVNRHNGNIEIDTGPTGTTVFVSFPLGK